MNMQLQYWFSVASPWTWLGSARFASLVKQAGAQVEVLPVDLGAVFAATGGRPYQERPEARRSYRQLDLARWAKRLDIAVTLEPRFYPVNRTPASLLLIAARQQGLDALTLSHAVLRAIWCDEQDIADWPTLARLASTAGHDGDALVASAKDRLLLDQLQQDTQRAISAGVFGAPTYVIDGERFWGQDRMDFVGERLGLS